MMLSNVKKLGVALLAAVALMLVAGESAKAQTPGQVLTATITNSSSVPVRYEVAARSRSGQSQWVSYELPAGAALNHHVEPGQQLLIRFDQGSGGGFVSYTLQTWVVPDRLTRGKPYVFYVDGSGYWRLVAV